MSILTLSVTVCYKMMSDFTNLELKENSIKNLRDKISMKCGN